MFLDISDFKWLEESSDAGISGSGQIVHETWVNISRIELVRKDGNRLRISMMGLGTFIRHYETADQAKRALHEILKLSNGK